MILGMTIFLSNTRMLIPQALFEINLGALLFSYESPGVPTPAWRRYDVLPTALERTGVSGQLVVIGHGAISGRAILGTRTG